MNEKKLKDAIDAIEPEAGAKERMYQNILKKAQAEAQPEKPQKQRLRLTHYALPVAACFCLLVVGLARLLPFHPSDGPLESGLLAGNSFVEVENAEAFRPLGITLDAPARAQEVSYAIIDGKIAQVQFKLDDRSYLARASAQEGDFSGLNGKEVSSETVDAKNNAVLSAVVADGATYQKLVWTNGRINYCLYGTDRADREQVLTAYEALKK